MTRDQQQKVRENRVRRAAARQGLRLAKSRRRDPHALDYGGYMLTDQAGNAVYSSGFNGFGLQLADIETYLAADKNARAEMGRNQADRPTDLL